MEFTVFGLLVLCDKHDKQLDISEIEFFHNGDTFYIDIRGLFQLNRRGPQGNARSRKTIL